MKNFTISILFSILLSISYTTANAKSIKPVFQENFRDSTLRIDYIFSGDATHQSVSLEKLNLMPRWWGKRKRLAELPIEGNGHITVRSHATGVVTYRNSFSTLFQEWLTYDEAKHVQKAFENVFLIPMPKDTVDVTIDLFNNRRKVTCSMTHTIYPNDILIRHTGFNQTTPYTTIQSASDTSRCIHIAFVAEGYRKEEMSTFINDAHTAVEAIFAHEPFKKMRDHFNIIAVESASLESGTSEPSKGIWRNTVLGSHFDTFYSDRYLTTLNLNDLHNVLAGTPYEHIIVLVNTSEYGGGGILNSYNLSMTHNPHYREVVVHEFGHSFAGLADEYAYEWEKIPMYPHDIEPWEKNITTLVDFKGKWENLIKPGTPVPTPLYKYGKSNEEKRQNHNKQKDRLAAENITIGAYEGAGYSINGVYRPCQNCRMRSNQTKEFCPACQKALCDIINFYTE